MRARSLVTVAGLILLLATPGCPKKETVGFGAVTILGAGVINDPGNKSLRFDLLKFGLERFCVEMSQRGAPLKLRDGEPVLGRFFAGHCSSQIIDQEQRQSFIVQYSGRGYAWTNLTGRIGFSTAGLIEYAPDFQLHEGAMYIYFRPRNVDASSFEVSLVESGLAQAGMAVAGVDPSRLGRDVVDAQLRRGFTVIRHGASGETELGLGIIPKGERPFRPFQVLRSDKTTLDNDRTELHTGQQDYVGGFRVDRSGQALYLTMRVDGAPAVDVFIVPKPMGDQMIGALVQRRGGALLPAAPLLDEVLPAGQQWRRYVPLPPGQYYLVLDHSREIGRSAPPEIVGDDRAARVDYLVQLGDRP